jgi:hypothetical protein
MINKRTAYIYDALNRILKRNQETSWEDIAYALQKEVSIRSWREVRSILQVLIDSRTIKRTNDPYTERYIRLS